jgi:hypothetical protein
MQASFGQCSAGPVEAAQLIVHSQRGKADLSARILRRQRMSRARPDQCHELLPHWKQLHCEREQCMFRGRYLDVRPPGRNCLSLVFAWTTETLSCPHPQVCSKGRGSGKDPFSGPQRFKIIDIFRLNSPAKHFTSGQDLRQIARARPPQCPVQRP